MDNENKQSQKKIENNRKICGMSFSLIIKAYQNKIPKSFVITDPAGECKNRNTMFNTGDKVRLKACVAEKLARFEGPAVYETFTVFSKDFLKGISETCYTFKKNNFMFFENMLETAIEEASILC